MEEKLIQTHITLLFYLILLFYLKNFTVSFIDVPKKLFNYIKVYYSFLILLTILGFFSKLLVLIRIFITHNINKIFRLLLKNNVNFECIKNHIRFNKSRKKVNYKDEKKLITNVVYNKSTNSDNKNNSYNKNNNNNNNNNNIQTPNHTGRKRFYLFINKNADQQNNAIFKKSNTADLITTSIRERNQGDGSNNSTKQKRSKKRTKLLKKLKILKRDDNKQNEEHDEDKDIKDDNQNNDYCSDYNEGNEDDDDNNNNNSISMEENKNVNKNNLKCKKHSNSSHENYTEILCEECDAMINLKNKIIKKNEINMNDQNSDETFEDNKDSLTELGFNKSINEKNFYLFSLLSNILYNNTSNCSKVKKKKEGVSYNNKNNDNIINNDNYIDDGYMNSDISSDTFNDLESDNNSELITSDEHLAHAQNKFRNCKNNMLDSHNKSKSNNNYNSFSNYSSDSIYSSDSNYNSDCNYNNNENPSSVIKKMNPSNNVILNNESNKRIEVKSINLNTNQETKPLKSILKKCNNTTSDKNKNNNRHIRFNNDVETYFFEKYLFEDDMYSIIDPRRTFYKILEAYNITNTEIFSYCNMRHNLNVVFNDIINSVFIYKDKIVKKF
ncbi:hypothetical protein PRSY57_0819600 [Plasmodium reichenowi]|uniref:Uncharacterized protein n=1 Tax=Plasmodium reichenowi TaxID=5854 RepID=A0A151LK21_PLARE|nr:hypothetical protein PRSY57_0819600 [Plasmodium reichenowi]KYN99291.1 hypothetical protein PRSY57_0819600 [Plasmodium reichenowi]